MRVRWTPPAAADLERIANHIRRDNPTAARAVVRAVLDSIAILRTYPHSGRPGEDPDTRELVVTRYPTYVVVYHVGEEAIEVWHVWHGAQDWPRAGRTH